MKNKYKLLIKTLLIFTAYLFYCQLDSYVLKMFGDSFNYFHYFLLDIFFMVIIIYIYRKDLVKDYNKLKKNYKLLVFAKNILKWIIIIFIINLLTSFLITIFFPNYNGDENTKTIQIIFNSTIIFTIFKTLVFAVIAEELIFRKTIRDLITNDKAFIFVSSLIYAIFSVMCSISSNQYILFDFICYFIPAIVFSIAYIKNKNNIVMDMFIKLCYHLIPLAFLIIGTLQ